MLRFSLALAVIIAHVGPLQGLVLGDGRLAVQVFFMISGFYMALVWTEKYSKLSSPIRTFYISRALRIYPLYFLVLIVMLLLISMGFFEKTELHLSGAVDELGWAETIWVYFTQITLIGMETSLFIDFPSNKYMVIPVAWTLGLELTFYLLVPFLLHRKIILISVLILSLSMRVLAYYLYEMGGFESYQILWSYRFFPFEVALFLFGSLAYVLYSNMPNKFIYFINRPIVHVMVLLGILGGLCYFRVIVGYAGEASYWMFYFIMFFGIVILFHHTKNSKDDSYLGELSYPMYILHIPILWIGAEFFNPQQLTLIVVPVTIVVSMVLCMVQIIVDNKRHILVKRQRILH